jgi:inward rectifier potassium channel
MTDIGGVSVMDYTHFHDVVAFEDTRPYGPQVI